MWVFVESVKTLILIIKCYGLIVLIIEVYLGAIILIPLLSSLEYHKNDWELPD